MARIALLNCRERTLSNQQFAIYAAKVDNQIMRRQIKDIERARKQKG